MLEAKLVQDQAKFQVIMDQYYLSHTNSILMEGDSKDKDGDRIVMLGQCPPHEASTTTKIPHIGDITSLGSIPLTPSDIDAAHTALASKMDEITKKGKLVKGIIKQLEIQHYDLHRKGLQFENDVKSAVDDIDARLLNVQAQEELIEMEWDRFQTEIKHKEEGLKTRETQLLMEAFRHQLSKILTMNDPTIFEDPKIIPLFEESNTNPIAMERLKAIINFRLDLQQAFNLMAIPDAEFHHLYEVLNQCNLNSTYYGATDTAIEIEFCCEQLSKQLHVRSHHYSHLVRFIFDTGDGSHINPHNTDFNEELDPLLSDEWKSDSDSGKAPKFTPELKIFFKTPNIADNTWIQCSGSGTVLWDIDPNFKLTLGSLCDPNRKGKFKSINVQDEQSSNGDTNNRRLKSPSRISFKWE